MKRNEITTEITRLIDAGDMDAVEANRKLNILHAYMEQLQASDVALRKYVVDHTAANEQLSSVFGVTTHRRGGEAKARVADKPAYGGWLYDSGEEGLTDSGYVLPIDEACDSKTIMAIMAKHGVKEIPGVEFSKARDDSAVVKPAASWDEIMSDPTLARQAMAEIMTISPMPEIAAKPTEKQSKESKERNAWDAI